MNILYLAPTPDIALAEQLAQHGLAVHQQPLDALDANAGASYAYIVLDLPSTDIRRLRQWVQRRGQAAVVVLLGEGGAPARIEALKNGADICLSRPFSADELHARLLALSRHLGAPAAAVAPGGLWLSNNRLLLGRGQRQQTVTVTEQRLLALLAVQTGAISRDAIEKHLWGEGGQHRGPLIERHICNLRRKLSDLGAPFALQTLRGFGYCLNEGLRVRTD